MILDLEVPAQHLDLVMVGKDDHIVAVSLPSGSCQASKRSDSVGGFPRTACTQFSSDFSGHEAVMHQVTQHLDWQLQTRWYPVANQPPNAPGPLLSKILHGLTTQLLRLVTPPLLVVQLPTLLQDQEQPSFHQDHDHDRHRTHLCSFGSISPTVQLLDFSVRVISHTGPYAMSSERQHEQRLFGQLSEIPVVVQRLHFTWTVSDSSEAGCESQQFQFANMPHLPPFELQCLELHTTLETHEI